MVATGSILKFSQQWNVTLLNYWLIVILPKLHLAYLWEEQRTHFPDTLGGSAFLVFSNMFASIVVLIANSLLTLIFHFFKVVASSTSDLVTNTLHWQSVPQMTSFVVSNVSSLPLQKLHQSDLYEIDFDTTCKRN